MQAITTRFHGPTDAKGARITARCAAGRMTSAYTYECLSQDHMRACYLLLAKLGWGGEWVGGGLPSGDGDAFVCTSHFADMARNMASVREYTPDAETLAEAQALFARACSAR